MIYRDPKCVFVANRMGHAEVTAAWLRQNGIEAQVMSPHTLGGLLGLTPWSNSAVSANGIEVWVTDPSQADRARELVAEQERTRATAEKEKKQLGPATATCETCHERSTFPAERRGKVEVCPYCGEYLDVPDGEPVG